MLYIRKHRLWSIWCTCRNKAHARESIFPQNNRYRKKIGCTCDKGPAVHRSQPESDDEKQKPKKSCVSTTIFAKKAALQNFRFPKGRLLVFFTAHTNVEPKNSRLEN